MTHQTVSEGRLNWFFRPALLRGLLAFCSFATAFYFAYLYGMTFSQACASPFWFPDAILLCALLLSRPRDWWLFIVGALPIRLFSPVAHGIPMWFLLTTFAIDSARAVFAAALLRRFIKNPVRMEKLKEFALFCVFAILLAPAVFAFGGAAALHALLGKDYWTAWEQWFMGNALAQLVVTPAILCWLFAWRGKIKMPTVKRCLEGGLLVAGLIVTAYMSFNSNMAGMDFPVTCFYAPIPLLFWAAIRFGMLGASGGIAIISVLSIQAAVHGRGPFEGQSPTGAALALQQFLLWRAAPVYLVGILIQQREKVERALRESEQRFRIMADSAPVMIWTSGVDKLCEFCNQGWLNFTGRTMEQELGNGWAEGLHPEDVQRCVVIYHSAFDARKPFEMEYRLRRRDGEYRWVMDRGVPRHAANGDFVGYVGSAVDLTDHKRAEEARQDLVHASRLAVLGELTAMIAHELNQPLCAILTNTEAMKTLLDLQIAPLDEARQILADIRQDDLRASEAIRRIRALVSKREMEMQPLDMNETVAEVVRMAKGDALRRCVQFHEEYCASVPVVQGDIVHLQQVVLNLILNGMDAMKDNLESERHLFVSTACKGDGFVEVAVKDVGHGVPPENLSRVFDSFFTTKQDGMGIGLSMARSIVQLHSGRLWAENNRDARGTTFRFTVPAVVAVPSRPEETLQPDECLTGRA